MQVLRWLMGAALASQVACGAVQGSVSSIPCPASVLVLRSAAPRVVSPRLTSVPLGEEPLGDGSHRHQLAEALSRGFTWIPEQGSFSMAPLLKDEEFQRRVLAFAADPDSWAATYTTDPLNLGARTMVRLHAATGELLVTDRWGRVGLYTRLPVNERAFAGLTDTAAVFTALTRPAVRRPLRGDYETHSRLTAGEDLGDFSFHRANRRRHFEKHVLDILPGDFGLLLRRTRFVEAERFNEFPELRSAFVTPFRAARGDIVVREALLDELGGRYERLAQVFAHSTAPTALTITRVEWDPALRDVTFTCYKFNPLTREFLIVDLTQRWIISYFRALDLSRSNAALAQDGMPPIVSAVEYFLTQAAYEDYRP